MKPEFIAIIGDKRIPTSARVIEIYKRTQGVVPFEFIPADPEADEPAGADWNAK